MARSRFFGATSVTSSPLIRIRPEVTLSSPAVIRSAVVLPQPDGPSSTRNSAGATVRLSSCSTVTAPKDLLIASSSTVMIPRLA